MRSCRSAWRHCRRGSVSCCGNISPGTAHRGAAILQRCIPLATIGITQKTIPSQSRGSEHNYCLTNLKEKADSRSIAWLSCLSTNCALHLTSHRYPCCTTLSIGGCARSSGHVGPDFKTFPMLINTSQIICYQFHRTSYQSDIKIYPFQ